MIIYTIATLVTDRTMYANMRASFEAKGFTSRDCDFVEIDNTDHTCESQTCAYAGYNVVLNSAKGDIVILCHQDVVLTDDGRDELELRLEDLTRRDPMWAVAGNAGASAPGVIVRRITDKHGKDQRVGNFPVPVMSLDENFIIVRKACRIGFSPTLKGFHFYGADICLAADVMGFTAYVIDFHLTHLGVGARDAAFAACEREFLLKWAHALRRRELQTPSTYLLLAGGKGKSLLRRGQQFVQIRSRRIKSSLLKRLAPARETPHSR